MLERICEFIEKENMINEGDRIVLGLSGGPDSIYLFHILKNLAETKKFTFVCIHVNHMLRGEAANIDESFVLELCKQNNIELEIVRCDVRQYAKKNRLSEEEAGRNIRRTAYESAMVKYGANKVALGHHMNDNAETLLLNLSRGSALKGLGGIAPVNGEYIRPLLCVTKDEIEKYLNRHNISYCVDKTNRSDSYARNRVRNNVIPYLENNINEKTVRHMNDAMSRIREVNQYMDEQVEKYYKSTVKRMDKRSGAGVYQERHIEGYIEKHILDEASYLISEKQYMNLEPIFRSEIIYKVIVTAAGKKKDIEEKHVNAVMMLFVNQVGRKIDLPYGITASREYEGIMLWKGGFIKGKVKEPTVTMKKLIADNIYSDIPTSSYTKWFDCDIITHTAMLRHRQSGDFITINKEGGKKKLKQFFIDEKIPREIRDDIWLICDGSHVMWVIGYRQSSHYQITDKTKNILEITISEEDYYE